MKKPSFFPFAVWQMLAFAFLSFVSIPFQAVAQVGETVLNASEFPTEGTGFVLGSEGQLIVDIANVKEASAKTTVPVGNGRFTVQLHCVGEAVGESTYEVTIGGRPVGRVVSPAFHVANFKATWDLVNINEGEIIEVKAKAGSKDGENFSQARWSKVVFFPLEGDPGKTNKSLAQTGPSIEDGPALFEPRGSHGDGSVEVGGELKQWHDVTVTLDGPWAHEHDNDPNPFLDYSMYVTFAHESGVLTRTVPGYFAADGDAANSSADSGTKWRAHLSPDLAGEWTYRVSFVKGEDASIDPSAGEGLAPFHGKRGSFKIGESDKSGRDFHGKGRLEYVGARYLRFAGTDEFFLKAGADAPETIFAYDEFDNTIANKPNLPLKTWAPHAGDFREGDPTWQDGKGKNLLGALNYLSSKGANVFSFLTYNAGGDGDNIWPFVQRNSKFNYDCSKLDQWGIVFTHAQSLGIYLHFKLQENELDDNRRGAARKPAVIPESLDGGLLGRERKLYLREIIARFSHNLALNWNLGEENTQTYEEQNDMAEYILNMDPYDHNIVIHTFPSQQEQVYKRLLGHQSVLTGTSLQNHWSAAHKQTLRWVEASYAAGKPWVVANDEQNPARLGVPPDPGYQGFDGKAGDEENPYGIDDIRKYTLWGTFMAGGAGVEYYFGYQLPENDLRCEDFRSRDKSWEYCGYAIDFFQNNDIPYWRMRNANELVGNTEADNSRYCLALEDDTYVVYVPDGGRTELDLSDASGRFSVEWYNPREGGGFKKGSVKTVKAGKKVFLGNPPSDREEDWAILVRK